MVHLGLWYYDKCFVWGSNATLQPVEASRKHAYYLKTLSSILCNGGTTALSQSRTVPVNRNFVVCLVRSMGGSLEKSVMRLSHYASRLCRGHSP
jgi:hypothetical protein